MREIDSKTETKQLKQRLAEIDSELKVKPNSMGLRIARSEISRRLEALKLSNEFFK